MQRSNIMNLKEGDIIKFANGQIAEIVVENYRLCTKIKANIPGEKDIWCYQPLSSQGNAHFKIIRQEPTP